MMMLVFYVLDWLGISFGTGGDLLLVLVYFCGLIPLSFFASLWLMWMYRRILSTTIVWGLFQLLYIALMASHLLPGFVIFSTSLVFLAFPLLIFVNFFYAYKRGIPLRFVGWGSVGYIWFILITWRIKGNLIDSFINEMVTGSNELWWFYPLFYGLALIVIGGTAAFIVETAQILKREFQSKHSGSMPV